MAPLSVPMPLLDHLGRRSVSASAALASASASTVSRLLAPRSSRLVARESLATGQIAGIVVGSVIGVFFILLCAYPFVIRYIRRYNGDFDHDPTGPGFRSPARLRGGIWDTPDPQHQPLAGVGVNKDAASASRQLQQQPQQSQQSQQHHQHQPLYQMEDQMNVLSPTAASGDIGGYYDDIPRHGQAALYYDPRVTFENEDKRPASLTDSPKQESRSNLRSIFNRLMRRSNSREAQDVESGTQQEQQQQQQQSGSVSPQNFVLARNPTSPEDGFALNDLSHLASDRDRAKPRVLPHLVFPAPAVLPSHSATDTIRPPTLVSSPATYRPTGPYHHPPPTEPFPGTVNPMDIMHPANQSELHWKTEQQLNQQYVPSLAPTEAWGSSDNQQDTSVSSPLSLDADAKMADGYGVSSDGARIGVAVSTTPVDMMDSPSGNPHKTHNSTSSNHDPPPHPTADGDATATTLVASHNDDPPWVPAAVSNHNSQVAEQVAEQVSGQVTELAASPGSTSHNHYYQLSPSPHMPLPVERPAVPVASFKPESSPIPDIHMIDALNQQYHHLDPDLDLDLGPDFVKLGHRISQGSDTSHVTFRSDLSGMPGFDSGGLSMQNTPATSGFSPGSNDSSQPDSRQYGSLSPSDSVPQQTSPHTLNCPKCDKEFDLPHKLNHHMRYHEKNHPCTYPGCGKSFGTKTHLQRHINDIHQRARRYFCIVPMCQYSRQGGGRSFPRKDNWRRHMVNIHSQNPQDDPDPDIIEPMETAQPTKTAQDNQYFVPGASAMTGASNMHWTRAMQRMQATPGTQGKQVVQQGTQGKQVVQGTQEMQGTQGTHGMTVQGIHGMQRLPDMPDMRRMQAMSEMQYGSGVAPNMRMTQMPRMQPSSNGMSEAQIQAMRVAQGIQEGYKIRGTHELVQQQGTMPPQVPNSMSTGRSGMPMTINGVPAQMMGGFPRY